MIRKLIFLTAMPLNVAFSQQQTPQPSSPEPPKVTVKAARPEYRSQATVTPRSATDSALARVPGGKVHEVELEKEHELLIYSFDIRVPNRSGEEEVQVDARSGKVVSIKHESLAAESKEQAKDREHASQHENSEDNGQGEHHEGGEHHDRAKPQPAPGY